jgi:hypothetical protein
MGGTPPLNRGFQCVPQPVVRKNLINLPLVQTRALTPRFFRVGTRGEDLRVPRLPKRDDVPESDAVRFGARLSATLAEVSPAQGWN